MLRKAFHDPAIDDEELYKSRYESEFAIKVGCDVAGFPAFCVLTPELSMLLVQAAKIDKDVFRLICKLPDKAAEDYMNACLIDEIVLTNEIENVHSTRREIGEVLDNLAKKGRRRRFHGIVAKYNMLLKGEAVDLGSCADIRKLYDDLALDEVLESDGNKIPDGKWFRKEPVSVVDGAEREIHKGVIPESKIIEMMECLLTFLNREDLNLLVRVAVCHFLFGYIHPFYDGNGRTNRFISSYMIANEYERLVGLRLSFAIKEEIEKYYKAFAVCEHPLNRGDLTPFVISFAEIVVSGMARLKEALAEREADLLRYENLACCLYEGDMLRVVNILIVASLFAVYGVTADECTEALGITRQTLYKRTKTLRDEGMLQIKKVGRKTYYSCDLSALEQRANVQGSQCSHFFNSIDKCRVD